MVKVDPLEELDSFARVRFPHKIGFREFVDMFEFIDRFVFPCTVNYDAGFKGKIGQREEETGETLAPHKYVEKGICGRVYSAGSFIEGASFFVNSDNDYDDYITKTRFVSLRFDTIGCDSLDELRTMKSSYIEVMQRVKAGIDLYFMQHTE